MVFYSLAAKYSELIESYRELSNPISARWAVYLIISHLSCPILELMPPHLQQ
ncbi:hypothetical protein JCM18900_1917 [Psychrobacter sp. JCM 18900]|nr:hypothetical protein JCM18900_1917 [Psychrobacter sp. JCM 18900]